MNRQELFIFTVINLTNVTVAVYLLYNLYTFGKCEHEHDDCNCDNYDLTFCTISNHSVLLEVVSALCVFGASFAIGTAVGATDHTRLLIGAAIAALSYVAVLALPAILLTLESFDPPEKWGGAGDAEYVCDNIRERVLPILIHVGVMWGLFVITTIVLSMTAYRRRRQQSYTTLGVDV